MEFGIQDMAFAWFQIMTTSNEIEVLNDMHTKKYTPFFVFIEGFYKENEHIFFNHDERLFRVGNEQINKRMNWNINNNKINSKVKIKI